MGDLFCWLNMYDLSTCVRQIGKISQRSQNEFNESLPYEKWQNVEDLRNVCHIMDTKWCPAGFLLKENTTQLGINKTCCSENLPVNLERHMNLFQCELK